MNGGSIFCVPCELIRVIHSIFLSLDLKNRFVIEMVAQITHEGKRKIDVFWRICGIIK